MKSMSFPYRGNPKKNNSTIPGKVCRQGTGLIPRDPKKGRTSPTIPGRALVFLHQVRRRDLCDLDLSPTQVLYPVVLHGLKIIIYICIYIYPYVFRGTRFSKIVTTSSYDFARDVHGFLRRLRGRHTQKVHPTPAPQAASPCAWAQYRANSAQHGSLTQCDHQECWTRKWHVPSGNLLHSYWKWWFSSCIFPLKMVIFHSYVNVYQRVYKMKYVYSVEIFEFMLLAGYPRQLSSIHNW